MTDNHTPYFDFMGSFGTPLSPTPDSSTAAPATSASVSLASTDPGIEATARESQDNYVYGSCPPSTMSTMTDTNMPYSEHWPLDLASLQAFYESTFQDSRLTNTVSDLFPSNGDLFAPTTTFGFPSSVFASRSTTPHLPLASNSTPTKNSHQSQPLPSNGPNGDGESSLSENERSEAFRQARNLITDVVSHTGFYSQIFWQLITFRSERIFHWQS